MNRLNIIGNVCRDPELRTTQTGISVCSFTVAVNRRHGKDEQQPQADFFRVTAWRSLGETCGKYLHKGTKVAVVGAVSVSTYQAQDGSTRASLDVNAEDVEFLSAKGAEQASPEGTAPAAGGMEEVTDEELPF